MSIPAQLSNSDINTLVDVMNFISSQRKYRYLEIGSYLGGSLQWHLNNPDCVEIVSVDKRATDKINDERQIDYRYTVTTQDMLDGLKNNNLSIDKLICVDGTVDDVPADYKFDLIFIDGEHTNTAVFHDAITSLNHLEDSAIMLFHDDWIVYKGIEKIKNHLDNTNKKFSLFKIAFCDISALVFGNDVETFTKWVENRTVPWNAHVQGAQWKLDLEIRQNTKG